MLFYNRAKRTVLSFLSVGLTVDTFEAMHHRLWISETNTLGNVNRCSPFNQLVGPKDSEVEARIDRTSALSCPTDAWPQHVRAGVDLSVVRLPTAGMALVPSSRSSIAPNDAPRHPHPPRVGVAPK
ncbi:unnamed protein product [Protopolystoma xenopodis]|uniref:Uncharacterized protein n=1 Tax=Protopolystoma xenopodis TaxID=117903 RepID=A0A3S5AUS3_9PLAT|nr:unnamed protein product [Protopolystoma xenopodis]